MANGKGSTRRPAAVDDAQVRSEWERIFPKRSGFRPLCAKCRSWHWPEEPHDDLAQPTGGQ